MTSHETSPAISLHQHVIQPTYPGSEPIYIHITKMKDAYMLWAGTAQSVKLNDWVVSMPMLGGADPAIATLFASSSSTISTSIASRLSRRFKKQMYVALAVPGLLHDETTADMDLLVLIEKNMTRELKQLMVDDASATASAKDAPSSVDVQVGR